MYNHNSILDAVHANMDVLIENGVFESNVKSQNVAECLEAIANAYAGDPEQQSSEIKQIIEAYKEGSVHDVANALGLVLNVVSANAGYEPILSDFEIAVSEYDVETGDPAFNPHDWYDPNRGHTVHYHIAGFPTSQDITVSETEEGYSITGTPCMDEETGYVYIALAVSAASKIDLSKAVVTVNTVNDENWYPKLVLVDRIDTVDKTTHTQIINILLGGFDVIVGAKFNVTLSVPGRGSVVKLATFTPDSQ